MKLIIAGGRFYSLTLADYARLDQLHEKYHITEVVSGGAAGADKCGERWAERKGIPLKRMKADWKRYGKSAGAIRNNQMAIYVAPDGALAIFPGGSGTRRMWVEAKRIGLLIFDWRGVL